MVTTPALTNSAAMLSVPRDFSIFIALTAASTFSCRIERGFSPGICWQLSAVGSPLVPYLYRSDLYSAHLFSILRSSVRHFPDFSCMVADLPCFSAVKNLIS